MKTLKILLPLILISSVSAFSDVGEDHPYKSSIDYAVEQGIVQGYEDGTFKPDKLVNRAEFLKIMMEAQGTVLLEEGNCFPDVTDQWFAPYVCTAKNKGWVKGNPDGNFAPERTVNYAEAAKMVVEGDFYLSRLIKDASILEENTDWYSLYTFALRYRKLDFGIDSVDILLKRGEVVFLMEGVKSFKSLGKFGYGKDKYEIYFNQRIIEGADRDSFATRYSYYAEDKNGVYYYGEKIKDSDVESFESFLNSYSKDKNYVYYEGEKIENFDEESFELLKYDDSYVKDKNKVYYKGLVIKEADPESVKVLGQGYIKDKNEVYYNGLKIEVSDGASFELLGDYGKDKNYAYYSGKIIENSDGASFELLFGAYTQDENFIYQAGKKTYYDKESFEVVDSIIVKDKHNVYLRDGIIENADVKSFESVGWGYSKDQFRVYYEGEYLENLDEDSFEILDYFYAKDKNYVYQYGEILKGVDPATFDPETYED